MKVRTTKAAGSLNVAMLEARAAAPADADQAHFEGVAAAIADSAILIFEERVRASMARAGVELPPGPINSMSLLVVLRSKTGIDVRELSQDGVREAVKERMASAVEEVLGVRVDLDAGLDEIVHAAALAAVESGRGNALVSLRMAKMLRRAAAMKAAGIDPTRLELRRASNRVAARKYRARNKFTWVKKG